MQSDCQNYKMHVKLGTSIGWREIYKHISKRATLPPITSRSLSGYSLLRIVHLAFLFLFFFFFFYFYF